jgi:hypothetical protein
MEFECPSCRGAIPVPSQYVGERVRCPHCPSYVPIPPAGGSTAPAPTPEQSGLGSDNAQSRAWAGELARLPRRWKELGPGTWIAAALAVMLLGLLLSYASGAPLRATRGAFEDLTALDRSGQLVTPAPYDLLQQRFPQSNAQRLVQLLAQIAPYLFSDDAVGQWVICGRMVKYYATMDPSYALMQDCLKDLRTAPSLPLSQAEWQRACDALLTIARQYHRSSALKRRCREDLAERLKVKADHAVIAQALRDYQDQVLAWETEQARQRQAAAESERQARQQRGAALSTRVLGGTTRTSGQQGPGGRHDGGPCVFCGETGKCKTCGGSGVTFKGTDSMRARVAERCFACKGSGICTVCGGTLRIPVP